MEARKLKDIAPAELFLVLLDMGKGEYGFTDGKGLKRYWHKVYVAYSLTNVPAGASGLPNPGRKFCICKTL